MANFFRENDPRSEFEGRGTLRNTLFPKGADALTPADKLRLQSLTGQEDDPLAELDGMFWNGNVYVEPPKPGPTEMDIIDAADPYPKGY